MESIFSFLRDQIIMQWLQGDVILELFDTYLLAQPDANIVLIVIGVSILSILGATVIVKAALKMTVVWAKVAIFVALIYYVFVVILNIDIWGLLGL
jgi:hypothetical protein